MEITIDQVYENIDAGKYIILQPDELINAKKVVRDWYHELAKAENALKAPGLSPDALKAQQQHVQRMTNEHSAADETYTRLRKAFMAEEDRLDRQFRTDMYAAIGIAHLPESQKQRAYDFACEYGADDGQRKTFGILIDIAAILLDKEI